MNFKNEIAALLADAFNNCFAAPFTEPECLEMIEVPPDTKLGDFALPCFRLAKTLRIGPPAIAKTLAESLSLPWARVEYVGGYVNFFIDRAVFAAETLKALLAAGERYGASETGGGAAVCIDYSSINIAKRFHIGHLSSTMIGNSLSRIYEYLGYKSVGINHLGDWGTQFGKMIAAYLKWGNRDMVERGGVNALMELYVRFHEEAEKDAALEDEGRAWFKKIEDGDETAISLFGWFKDVTLAYAEKLYELLGVHFDSYLGESFYVDKWERVVSLLREKGLLKESEGAHIVDLEEYNMPPCIILKKDGASIYATRDLATAFYREETYHPVKSLYVVAYQQDLHFRQFFKVLELMDCEWASCLEHVAHGMVSYEGRTLATREGHIVYLDDLIDRAVDKARDIIEEKSPNLANKDDVAKQVGIGSLVFSCLSNNRIKDIDFWWDRALNFDGETGPYVQYTHARCCSVLRKAAAEESGELGAQACEMCDIDYEMLTDDEAQAVIRALAVFPEIIHDACKRNEPSIITRHTVLLAQTYNKFYFEHRILDDDAKARRARLLLTRCARDTLAKGLYLIGIEAPEAM